MNKFISFLDILGYKQLIENNTTEQISTIYSEAIDLANEKAIKFWESQNMKYSSVDYAIISDSIVIWTEQENHESLTKILYTTMSFYFAFLVKGLPTRGAIVRGELERLDKKIGKGNVNSPIFFGSGLTKAYSLESNQNWSGCIVDESCFENVNKEIKENSPNFSLEDLVNFKVISEYRVPLKSGEVRKRYCLSWPHLIINRKLFENSSEIIEKFKMHNKSIDEWRVKYLVDNTVKYYEWEMNQPKPAPRLKNQLSGND